MKTSQSKVVTVIIFGFLLAFINYSPMFKSLWNIHISTSINFGVLIWIFSPLVLFISIYWALRKDSLDS